MEDTAELEAAPHSEADERVRAEPEAPRRKQRVPRPAEHDPAPDVGADVPGQGRRCARARGRSRRGRRARAAPHDDAGERVRARQRRGRGRPLGHERGGHGRLLGHVLLGRGQLFGGGHGCHSRRYRSDRRPARRGRPGAGMARPICGRHGMADCGGRHGMAGQGPFRRCRAQRSSQMRSSAAELVWEAPGVSAHCVETDPRSASGRDLHYLSWIGKNRAAPSAPRPWPSAETSSARGRRPLRIVKLVDDLRPSNRRLQASACMMRPAARVRRRAPAKKRLAEV